MRNKFKLPNTVYNSISGFGALLAASSLAVFIFLFIVTLFINISSPYLGMFMFIIVPPFLVIGLTMIPIGMYLTHRKIKRGEEVLDKAPVFDFNKTSHRNAAMFFMIGTVIFLLLTAVGSYSAFHFTESNTFCGEVCHSVMHPEFAAYQQSPHAQVRCIECHVGEGVGWYVKSKLSGLRQVYGVITGDFERPIQTPIHNLRPARETCEKCHWPEKFYARTDRLEKHYLSDEENSEWQIALTLKVGGEHSSDGLSKGIHWHINPNTLVEYASNDYKRQEIPWVRLINKETHDTTVFIDSESDFELANLDTMEIRQMDCIDCHNRPSHQYLPPDKFIDKEIAAGNISSEIPEIKSKLMEICEEDFTSIDSFKTFVTNTMEQFYTEDYEEYYNENKGIVLSAENAFVDAYSKNIFPQMNVKWDKYPFNIGHMDFPGCFRCHNDSHESEDGKLIPRDCQSCHEINAQGNPDNLEKAVFGSPLEFKHPVDIDGAWQEMNCSECHTGLLP